MGKSLESGLNRRSAIIAMRRDLAHKVAAHAPFVGENATKVPGLSLYRKNEPTGCYCATYEPSFTVFLQGRKRINQGFHEYICDSSSFAVSSIDIPVESQIIEASKEVPLLLIFFRLDMATVRDVLNRDVLPDPSPNSLQRGICIGETTIELINACTRLIDLLNSPEDIPFLAHLIQSEIVYRILRMPQGERLRAIATTGDLNNRTARAIAWLRANYSKPLHMEELAEIARMGVSTLHREFRALTAMSPLQYQKRLRLQAARDRMLRDQLDATRAAYEVGYESVSQFCREYGRLFGRPPLRDIRALRDAKIVTLDPI